MSDPKDGPTSGMLTGPSRLDPGRAALKYLVREMDEPAREFYRRLAEDRQLASTRCERCAATEFPPRRRCPSCGGPLAWVELPRRGRLYAFTTQETALRFAAPAVLALVQVADVVLPAVCLRPYEELQIDQEVEVELLCEPDTGLTLLSLVPCGR